MNQKYSSPYVKKRKKLKYKNIAIALAIVLIVIALICTACTARKNKKDGDKPLVSGDQQNVPVLPPLEDDPDADAEQGVVSDPTDQKSYTFDYVTLTADDLGKGELVLVNNNNKFLGTVNEDDLVVVRDEKNKAYWVKDRTVIVLPQTMKALNAMLLDFYNATGNDNVMAKSGYRTIEYQQELYDSELKKTGADSSDLVAKAGYSEHHTGFVVDFTTYNGKTYTDFDGTGTYKWIMDNCHKYGFINRYPKGKEKLTLIDNEPWHFRYVGIPHASIMADYDYCLEEYISFIKNYTIKTGFLLKEMDDGSQYLVYYTPLSDQDTTGVYYPLKPDGTPYPYKISGNNIDGFIVTVTLKEADPVSNIPAIPDSSDNGGANENGEAGD